MKFSIINEVRVTFNFQKNNELILTIVSPIEDNDQVQLQNEGFWLLKNGILINFDEQGDFQEHVYLVRE
mgnify:CR=1 FL=1